MNDPLAKVTDASSVEVPTLRLGRLALLQCAFAAVIAIAVGSILAAQFSFGLSKFGGLEYAPRLVMLSGVRLIGPGSSATGALLALTVWTHRSPADAIRTHLLRAALQTLLVALLGAVATTALVIASGVFVVHAVFAVPWESIASGRSAVSASDIPAAIATFLEGALLVSSSCWFALPAMARRSWSLAHQIGVWCGLLFLLRIALSFL